MDTDKTPPRQRKQASKNKPNYKWIGTIFGTTVVISATFSFVSNEILGQTGTAISFLVLLAIIFVGIIFDIVGVAVTASNEQPFHSMAARKVPEAVFALRLLRKADRVSSFCNDVIGDICGIISGTASAAIAAGILKEPSPSENLVINLLLSALVAGLTVGGKAFGKHFAMHYSIFIVHRVAKILYGLSKFGERFKKLFSRR